MTEPSPTQSASQQSAVPPDLAKGIPTADVPEGAMVAGLVGAEEVLVARVGGTLFAVAALCTHYHGALAQGLLVGETVRCPLHHARFCLRTGEALAAPAFDPLKRWTVREADGVVRVDAAIAETPAQPSRRVRSGPRRVVVVGGGAAGFAAVEMLRREGFDGSLTMLSADPDAPYDRPSCSKDYLAGTAPAEWMPLRGDDWYSDNDIELRLATEIAGLDPTARRVSLNGGEALPYDALVLALGAEPSRPPIPGLDAANAYTLRSLADAGAII